MHRLAIVAVVVAAAVDTLTPLEASAQDTGNGPLVAGPVDLRTPNRHAALGLELSFLVPRGDFAPGSGLSVGYGVRGAIGVGPEGMVDIGAAFRSVAHDSHSYGDSVDVKNMLRTLSVSGRFALPFRVARPYVGASIGAAYFGTETLIERCCDEDGDYVWELDDLDMVDLLPTASTRVGLLVDLSGRRGQPVLSLDLGMENHYGRAGRYQIGGRGDIRRTGTSYRVYSLGLTVRSR